jgi:predicted dehydrogenase
MSQMEAIRIGLIGAGVMGRLHASLVSSEPATVLAAVADPLSDKVARSYGVPAFTDHRELLASKLVDAVIVASPNPLHVDTALDCLDAGIPALLEKPVATTSNAAKPLLDRVEFSTTPILVGHHRRHHFAVRAAKSAIESGALGRPISISGQWLTQKTDDYFDLEWHRQPGAGVLLINLVHDIDLFRYFFGEVRAVQASVSSAIRHLEVEDTASVLLEFESGAFGTLIGSDSAAAPWSWERAVHDDGSFPFDSDAFCYTMAGSNGAIEFPRLVSYRYGETQGWHAPMSRSNIAISGESSFVQQLKHFIRVVQGLEVPAVSVRDAVATLAVVEAAQAAAASGRRVLL